MTDVTITGLDEALAARLRRSAETHGRSLAAEARALLEDALGGCAMSAETAADDADTGADIVRAIRAPLEEIGGYDLELPPRGPGREPPDFRNLPDA